MNRIIGLLILALVSFRMNAQGTQELLDFEFEEVTLSGVLNFPTNGSPKGIVLIVHGDGKTDAVAGKWYYDVREAILQAGYATYMWDKMGCGKSGGTYKNGQPVENAAFEVIAAIKQLKENQIQGTDKIGLWGISRAGWINPIVINQFKTIDFWISVSGVDDVETFKYLLAQNLRIIDYPRDTIDLLVEEWHDGLLLSRDGASYDDYLSTTKHLQKNKFWLRINNGITSEKEYYDYQKILQTTTLDKATNLPLYVDNFEQLLSRINIPVLAFFGELDHTVNWKSARQLYEKTLGLNTDLTIQSFPDCNHNMWQCSTGGIYEFVDTKKDYIRCAGFLEGMTNWLNALK